MKCLKIFSICFIIFLLLIAYSSFSFAVYQGDNSYTDKNNTLYIAYNSILNDFINRLANTSSNTKNTIIGLLKNPSVNYYVYYGSPDGSSLINGSTYKTDVLYVYFTSASSPSFNATQYNNYQGITTDILQFTDYTNFYRFNGTSIQDLGQYEQSQSVYVPSVFLGYKSYVVTNFLTNSSAQETESILSAIEDQTTAIEEQTEVQNQINESITDSDVSDSSMSVDTSSFGVDDSQGVDNFFVNLLTSLKNIFSNISTDVSIISIPIPFTSDILVLRSDIVSRYVVDTPLYTLIQLVWWYVFGTYFILFSQRIIVWLSTGKIAEKGVFSFVEWLDFHNEIIKSYMM